MVYRCWTPSTGTKHLRLDIQPSEFRSIRRQRFCVCYLRIGAKSSHLCWFHRRTARLAKKSCLTNLRHIKFCTGGYFWSRETSYNSGFISVSRFFEQLYGDTFGSINFVFVFPDHTVVCKFFGRTPCLYNILEALISDEVFTSIWSLHTSDGSQIGYLLPLHFRSLLFPFSYRSDRWAGSYKAVKSVFWASIFFHNSLAIF